MPSAIAEFQLINFQSWSNLSQSVKLEPDVLNILKGANETGKSVFFKVIYEMCFPGYWGPDALLRYGCSDGLLAIILQDGKQIGFQLFRNKTRKFFLIDGENQQTWTCEHIPHEITTAMGLVIVEDCQIILNVIDKDVPAPFVKTTPRFNASVLRWFIEPESIRNLRQNAYELLCKLSTTKQNFKRVYDIYNAKQLVLNYTDVGALKLQKAKLLEFRRVLTAMSPLRSLMTQIQDVKLIAPKPLEDKASKAKPLMDLNEAMVAVKGSLSRLQVLLSCPPVELVDPAECSDMLTGILTTDSTLKSLQNYQATLASKPAQVQPVYLQAGTLLSASHSVQALCGILRQYNTATKALADCISKEQEAHDKLHSLEDTLGVCPTCGRAF